MATVQEVLLAFLGKGKDLPRKTRSGTLKAEQGPHDVQQLWSNGRLLALRWETLVAVDRAGHLQSNHRSRLQAEAARVGGFTYQAGWAGLQPTLYPSELVANYMPEEPEVAPMPEPAPPHDPESF